MGSNKTRVCDECGAKLAPDAEFCDLCGAEVPELSSEAEPDVSPAVEAGDRACPQCNAVNPPEARFCNQCGRKLEAVSPKRAPAAAGVEGAEADPESRAAVRNGLLMAAVAVVAVIVLFGITLLSQRAGAPPPEMVPPAEVPVSPLSLALPAEVQAQADALKREIERAPDEITELDRRQQLVSLYRDAGRPDLAAEAQRPVAEALETAYAWSYLGDLYYEFMLARDADHAAAVSPRVAEAYRKSLEIEENLDVRTHLAVAYLYDATNPMRAVDEINLVLERDPDHVQANFNRGMMLAQIGRLDQAAEQFRRVLSLTEEGTLPHDRAHDALASVEAAIRSQ